MKKTSLLLLTIIQVSVFGQKKIADHYYQKGDYKNAALYYKKHLDRYKHTKKVIAKIADSYYRTFQFRQAKHYITELTEGNFIEKDKTFDNEFNFKMHHVLSALGNYEEAVNYLEIYHKNTNETFNKKKAIETIESFRLKTDDYTTNNIKISDTFTEFGAVFKNDSLYFISDRKKSVLGSLDKWTHKPFLNIYKANLSKSGKVITSSISALPKTINSKLHEGNFCFSKDGQTLYFSRSNIQKSKKSFSSKKINTIQLFKSQKINGIWETPTKLPFCKDEFSYEHPTLNASENKIYFSSNEGKNTEDFDIFYVEIDENHQQYGTLVNLGTTINTKHREHFPFLDEKDNLFFASNGHLGIGMLDIFVSELVNNKYTSPINLGSPINSKYDDFSLVYTDEKNGYFASNRKGINDHIYSFLQTGPIFIREYLVNFEVRDSKTEELLTQADVELVNNKNNIIYTNSTNKFTTNLIPAQYTLKASSKGYINDTITVETSEEKNQKYILYLTKETKQKTKNGVTPESSSITNNVNNTNLLQNNINSSKELSAINLGSKEAKLKLIEDNEGPKIIIKNGEMYFDVAPIYFDFDKWSITDKSKKILYELAKKLDRHKNIHIKITAHTDSRGTIRYNQFLSEKRAESTRNFLALEGFVNARRMQFKGLGETSPIINCKPCSEKQHQENRRSEFKIIKY